MFAISFCAIYVGQEFAFIFANEKGSRYAQSTFCVRRGASEIWGATNVEVVAMYVELLQIDRPFVFGIMFVRNLC